MGEPRFLAFLAAFLQMMWSCLWHLRWASSLAILIVFLWRTRLNLLYGTVDGWLRHLCNRDGAFLLSLLRRWTQDVAMQSPHLFLPRKPAAARVVERFNLGTSASKFLGESPQSFDAPCSLGWSKLLFPVTNQ